MTPKDTTETRQDTWWITEEYLSLACHLVASQFIEEDDKPEYPSFTAFAERAAYLMRNHCPIAYSYFFQAGGTEVLPSGTLSIILDIIIKKRPLFTVRGVNFGGINSGTIQN